MHQRPVYRTYDTIVRHMADVTPAMRRITLHGQDLKDFDSDRPGQWIKLFFDDSDTGRAFTIRHWRPDLCEIDVDFVRHGEGVAASWIATTHEGVTVRLAGPRSDFAWQPARQLFLFGDETAIPAISAIVEALPADAWAMVVIEVTDEAARQVVASQADVRWTWLVNTRHAPGAPLVEYVQNLTLGAESAQIWIGCECCAARTLRTEFRRLGFDKHTLHASGYWKQGVDEHVDHDSDY